MPSHCNKCGYHTSEFQPESPLFQALSASLLCTLFTLLSSFDISRTQKRPTPLSNDNTLMLAIQMSCFLLALLRRHKCLLNKLKKTAFYISLFNEILSLLRHLVKPAFQHIFNQFLPGGSVTIVRKWTHVDRIATIYALQIRADDGLASIRLPFKY